MVAFRNDTANHRAACVSPRDCVRGGGRDCGSSLPSRSRLLQGEPRPSPATKACQLHQISRFRQLGTLIQVGLRPRYCRRRCVPVLRTGIFGTIRSPSPSLALEMARIAVPLNQEGRPPVLHELLNEVESKCQ